MSRKALAGTLVVALGLLAVLALLAFYSPAGRSDDIVYMPGVADDSDTPVVDGSEGNRRKLAQVTIDRSNVQRVLATLSRPEAYQLTANLTYSYLGGSGQAASRVLTVTAKVRPGHSKTVLAGIQEGARTQTHTLLAGGRAYIWEEGSDSVYEGSAGSFGTDDLMHMPTYETLLARSPESITDGYIDSESDCVVVASVDPDTGYAERWAISIRDGLLMDYQCFSGKTLVFSATVQEARTGAEGMSDADFALPDGSVPAA